MSHHGCPERLSNRSKGFEDGPSQSTMEVLVETLTGTAFEMTVSPSDTVFAIKSKICRVEGIPVAQQHLLYNLRELEDGLSLSAHGVRGGARLRLVLGLRGGPVATRRHTPHWRDLERLLDTRDEAEWSGGSSACRVTVLVFRDGERVNMVRVKQNTDGTYSPVDSHHKYSSSLPQLPTQAGAEGAAVGAGAGSLALNARTQHKMAELRRRMDALNTRQKRPRHAGAPSEIQKTRSEEVLSVASLSDATPYVSYECAAYDAEDGFYDTPLYDSRYTRYGFACELNDRFTLLPPIGTRTDSEQSIQEAVEAERLEIELSRSGVECSLTLPAADTRPPIATDCGPLLGAGPAAHPHSQSASSLARAAPPCSGRPKLKDAVFSSSTSDLEQLRRNRLLPALSRHRNTEHLHLSDDRLDTDRENARLLQFGDYEVTNGVLTVGETVVIDGITALTDDLPANGGAPSANGGAKTANDAPTTKNDAITTSKEVKKRVRCTFCRKKLSIATVHRCRCGSEFCAPHRYAEVHGCAYDYKAAATQYLQRANPLVSAPKLPKI